MTTKENKNFLAELLEDTDADNALRKVSVMDWWADFKYADELGWTFKMSKKAGGGTAFTAYRDQSVGWFDSITDLLINVLMATSAEDYAYPGRSALRAAGWKCRTTTYSSSYVYKGDVDRALFHSVDAAWNDLLRSMP